MVESVIPNNTSQSLDYAKFQGNTVLLKKMLTMPEVLQSFESTGTKTRSTSIGLLKVGSLLVRCTLGFSHQTFNWSDLITY